MSSQPFDDIPPWPPARYTAPLSADFPSAFDPFRELFLLVWRNYAGYELEPWQIELLRAALELYPAGHTRAGQLRFLTVVISLARQNGKTEIAAALGLWALLVKKAALVVGLATSAEQARLIYDRTMGAIKGTPQLKRMFRALTETRGIRTLTGGKYEIKAAKSDALQGLPLDLGLVDELHILAATLWEDLVNGLGGRPNCLVVGVTTAGDDNSALLLHLYELGEAAIAAGDAARMGFFVWEAPESRIPDDDELLGRYLAHANPGVASGRVDLENTIAAVRGTKHPNDAIRYRLNRFVSSVSVFISAETWARCTTADQFPEGVAPIFVIDRTPEWQYASVTAAGKRPDGRIYLDLVASLVHPTLEKLAELCVELNRHAPATFVVDGYSLKDLGAELERRGLPVTTATRADNLNGSALFYSKVQQRLIAHPGHPLLSMQIPRAVRKNVDDGFRLSRKDSAIEIDAAIGHVLGTYFAETRTDTPLQMF